MSADAALASAERIGVIDIGSNSIRLVVYGRLGRMPMPVFNEKVLCGLGRDLATTGRLHPKGVAQAKTNLLRFARLLDGMRVGRVDVLATAAVRDAADGPDFVAEVERRCGFTVTIVSGEEEARLSALGVLSGSPGADGVMGDLGGGSLELVGLDAGIIGERHVTLPLGPFRLMAAEGGRDRAREVVDAALAGQPWLAAYRGRTFHPVGGAWRSIARAHMAKTNYPLHIIHNYAVPASELRQLAAVIAQQGATSLDRLLGVSKRRLETLPAAALVLERVLAATGAERVVFSAYGLREGHLYDQLTPEQQAADPLLETCREYAVWLDRFGLVERIAAWMAPLFPAEPPGFARLREAAGLLSDITWADHPDYRAEHAFLRTLRLPLAGLDHPERAFIATALYVRYGGAVFDETVAPARAVMQPRDLARAGLLGTALRFVHTLTGGAFALLDDIELKVEPDGIVVTMPAREACLMGDVVQRRLDALGRAFGRSARLVTVAGAPRPVTAA